MPDSRRGYSESLIGLSAGHICYGEHPAGDPIVEAIEEAAAALWENLMSPWILTAILRNGTTLWESPDGADSATVDVAGHIRFAALR